jgi:hypothetical protein
MLRTSPPGRFYERKCQEQYLPTELKSHENRSWHSAPLARDLPVCAELPCGAGSSPTNGRRKVADDFYCLAFPLVGKRCSERPGAVQGAPIGAAELPWAARTILK